ncbi:MAG: hypothetical protein QOG27_682, partial [Verrucomicrobiota bacterium]
MDMPAEHGIDPVALGVADNRRFEFPDEIHGVLDPLLGVGTERPIAEAEPPPDKVDQRIEAKQELVAKVAGKGEPARVLDHRIELVSMNDEDASAIGRQVDRLFLDRDMTVVAAKAPHQFIVIPGDVDDARAFARFAQKFLDDVVVLLRPVNSAAHLPGIDEVADDVERFQFVIAEEIEQGRGLTAPRSKMNIGDPRRAKAARDGRRDDTKISKSRKGLGSFHSALKIAGADSCRQSQFCYVSVTRRAGKMKFASPEGGFRRIVGKTMFWNRFVVSAVSLFALVFHAIAGEDASSLYAQAQDLMRRQQFAAAIPLLEKCVAAEPGSSKFHQWLGRALGLQAAQNGIISSVTSISRVKAELEKAIA